MIRSVEQESSIPRVTSAVGAFRTFEALESVWVHRRAIPAPTALRLLTCPLLLLWRQLARSARAARRRSPALYPAAGRSALLALVGPYPCTRLLN